MKCGNCRAWNAHVIYLEDEKWILCPRCLSILKNLNQEYLDIVSYSSNKSDSYQVSRSNPVSPNEVPSTSSRGEEML